MARSPAAAKTTERPARERIFAVAKDLFYRRGIRAVGVETIVAEAGATKMSLYRSYPSKDDLVVAYLEERDARYWTWWDDVVARHPNAPRDQLRTLLGDIATRVSRPKSRGCPFTNAATEFPEPDHPGRKIAERNKQELRRRLTEIAAALGARNPKKLGDQLFLAIEGTYATANLMGAGGPIDSLVDTGDALVDAALGA
jgi:AcrR family transcriptional regulator